MSQVYPESAISKGFVNRQNVFLFNNFYALWYKEPEHWLMISEAKYRTEKLPTNMADR